MKLCRAYCSEIPQNVLKNKSSIFHKSKSVLPLPTQILHPFYSPSRNEELTACFKEVRPELLDGKRIMPCLLKDSVTLAPILKYCSLKFDTVRGVNKWLQEFNDGRSQKRYVFIDDKDTTKYCKPSKLEGTTPPEVKELAELFNAQEKDIELQTLDSVLDELLTSESFPVFCEDIFSYLLEHHVKSIENITVIVDSIKCRLHSDIDQFTVAENLIFQVLLCMKKKIWRPAANLWHH